MLTKFRVGQFEEKPELQPISIARFSSAVTDDGNSRVTLETVPRLQKTPLQVLPVCQLDGRSCWAIHSGAWKGPYMLVLWKSQEGVFRTANMMAAQKRGV